MCLCTAVDVCNGASHPTAACCSDCIQSSLVHTNCDFVTSTHLASDASFPLLYRVSVGPYISNKLTDEEALCFGWYRTGVVCTGATHFRCISIHFAESKGVLRISFKLVASCFILCRHINYTSCWLCWLYPYHCCLPLLLVSLPLVGKVRWIVPTRCN